MCREQGHSISLLSIAPIYRMVSVISLFFASTSPRQSKDLVQEMTDLCGVIECKSSIALLQCVAVCCSVLQCVAVCCNVWQCVAVCCNVWHTDLCGVIVSNCSIALLLSRSAFNVAVCCSVLLSKYCVIVAVCCSVL